MTRAERRREQLARSRRRPLGRSSSSRLFGFALAALVVAAILIGTQANAPVRARQNAPRQGSIAGTVQVSNGEPAAEATVTLREAQNTTSREAVTDSQGRFRFNDVPAGHFLLHAAKPGFVATNYGASSRGKPGLILAVGEGQAIDGLSMSLSRGAAISGRLVNDAGAPVAGAEVSALERLISDLGVRWLRAAVATSDDRGAYRLFGLGDGEYAIAAVRPDLGAGPTAVRSPSMAAARATAARIGAPQGAGTPEPPPSYLPVFFPGTTDTSAPGVISVRSGGDQADMNFTVHAAQASEIQGRLLLTSGVSMRDVRVSLTAPSESVLSALGYPHVWPVPLMPDGRFVAEGVPPGNYAVLASTVAPAPHGATTSDPAPAHARDWYALTTAVVSGRFLGLDTLRLATGANVSGRVVVEGGQLSASIVSRVALRLNRVADGQALFDLPQVRPDSTGAFTFTGVPPGHYVVVANLGGASPDDRLWHVSRVTSAGRDFTDTPLQIVIGEDAQDIVVTLTNRVTELTGSLLDTAGRITSDYYVIVFSVDAQMRRPGSRWLRAPLRPASDGSFKIVGLPGGDYYMAGLTDYDPAGWWTPSFLDALVPAAIRITLVDGQKLTQSVRVRATR